MSATGGRVRSAVAALALLAGFARLGESGLQFLDSWCYARVSVEMAASGDWVVPTWRGEPFLEKPPLLFWLTAGLYRGLGVSEFAARAVAGAATAGCVALAFALASRAAGPACGAAAALLLCATPMFLKWGRTYTTDPLLAVLNLAALGCGWRAGASPRLWPAAGALAALAVLARGAAAAPLLASLGWLAWSGRRTGGGRPGRVAAGLAAFLALALPWHILAARRAGPAFTRTYLLEHTLERAGRNLIDSPRSASPLYYPAHLARTGWPALPFLLWGLVRLRRTGRPPGDPLGILDRALLVNAGAQAAMLALVASRSPRYLLPLYPVLALLAARGLTGGLGETGSRRLCRAAAAAAVAAAVVISVWPAPLGTARGEPFRRLARAIELEGGAGAAPEVESSLIDPWFERAFWFYLGRAPRAAPEDGEEEGGAWPGAAEGESGAAARGRGGRTRLRIAAEGRAAACLPPACQVLERAGPYVLLRGGREAGAPGS